MEIDLAEIFSLIFLAIISTYMFYTCKQNSFIHKFQKLVISLVLLLSWQINTFCISVRAEISSETLQVSPAQELAKQIEEAYGGMQKIKDSYNRSTRAEGKIIPKIATAETEITKNIESKVKELKSQESEANKKATEIELKAVEKASKTIMNKLEELQKDGVKFTAFEKAGKTRTENTGMGQSVIEVFDGKNGWKQIGSLIVPMTPLEIDNKLKEHNHDLDALCFLEDAGYKLETLPTKVVQNKNCIALKEIFPNGTWTVFYADPQTHLVLRCEYMKTDNNKKQVVEAIEYFDYKPVDGMPTPFRAVIFNDGKENGEAIFNTIILDDSVQDNLFAMPQICTVSGLSNGPVTIPFDYIGNEIYITVRINNSEEVKIMVDTGFTYTCLNVETAALLGPHAISAIPIKGIAGMQTMTSTNINQLSIGNITLDNVPVLVGNIDAFTPRRKIRKYLTKMIPVGVIGANVLSQFLVTIDYQNHQLVLSDPLNVTPPANAIIIPTSVISKGPLLGVSGKLNNGQSMNFLVDTGAALNVLPKSMVNNFETGPTLVMGKMAGVGGSVHTGLIRLNNFSIGDFSVHKPVFTFQSENNVSLIKRESLSNETYGILGNPIWSKAARLTIDYRNQRLILELSAEGKKLDKYLSSIEDIDKQYWKTKNLDVCTQDYNNLVENAKQDNMKIVEAQALSHLARLFADKFQESKDNKWVTEAAREYAKAQQIAHEFHNRNIEAQILSQWGLLYLSAYINSPNNNQLLSHAENLLKRSLIQGSNDSIVLETIGEMFLKAVPTDSMAWGNAVQNAAPSIISTMFIDESLLLDPANWHALWAKLKLLEASDKPAEEAVVLSQLELYYPDCPQVQQARKELSKKHKQSTTSNTINSLKGKHPSPKT